MGLITCPDCKREVSDKAERCPHCGSPLREAVTVALPPERSGCARGCGILILGFVVIMIISIVLGSLDSSERGSTMDEDLNRAAQPSTRR